MSNTLKIELIFYRNSAIISKRVVGFWILTRIIGKSSKFINAES